MSDQIVNQAMPGLAGNSPAPILEVRDLAVHYGGVKAVDGLSFMVDSHKIFGVLGPNGSGKSTLMGAITRLVNLTRGSMLLDGQAYETQPASMVARLGFGRTFQTVRLLSELTIAENIMLGADVHRVGESKLSKAAARAVVDNAVEQTALAQYVQMRPTEVSYGVQRRVEIARALATRPRILILDEPTAGMNYAERNEVVTLLMKLRAGGLTQILVEHDVQMMVETCDHVLAMNFGKCIAHGLPSMVIREPAVQDAYLGRKWREHA
jgi:branched-chain amino acid transport system ATP-binding protein